jgi:hypothetical protein
MHTTYTVSNREGATPDQLRHHLPDQRIRSLPENAHWTTGKSLPLVEGKVHCMRLTDNQARLCAFGQDFKLEDPYRHTYIRATLQVAQQQLQFFFQESAEHEPQLIDRKPFSLADEVLPYDPNLLHDLLL